MPLPLIYNWRNLFVRKSNTLLTFGVVALIVFVLTWALAFGNGMRETLSAGGALDKLIVIKPGATGESTSVITLDEFKRLAQLEGVSRSSSGEPAISGEMCTQISLPRKGDASAKTVPVAVRGVEPAVGFAVHPTVRIVQGRAFGFEANAGEIIVGKAIAERVVPILWHATTQTAFQPNASQAGLQIGDELVLGYKGNRTFRVVGVFEAAGGPLESEIWGPASSLKDAFGREMLSSVAMKIDDPGQAPRLIDTIRIPPYQLTAKTERQYYQDIADKSSTIVELTLVLVVFMAIGACFAVANTIYAAVDGRSREIAMLRTIGYSRVAVVTAFLLESLLICGAASLLGAGVAMMFEGQKQDFMAESTWSTFAYEIRVTPVILLTALIAAVAVAVIGAVVPAVRAARIDIITALRQT